MGDWNELWPKKNSALFVIFQKRTQHCSSSSFFFPEKAGPVTNFAAAFNVPNVHQIWQILHENDPLQFVYSSKWTFQFEWQLDGASAGLNMSTQAAFSADLTVHHAYFEPTVGILPNWIKGWNFTPV